VAFTIPFFEEPLIILDKIRQSGSDVDGDTDKGQIKINTELGEAIVSYKFDGNALTVEVLKRPYILSEGIIKEELLKLF
jgi:hypothetical protein